MSALINAIIFDFGGVLLNWDPRHLYNRFFPGQPKAVEDFLTEVDFYTWNAQQDKGRSFKDGIEEYSRKFPHHAHLLQAYYDHWEDSITDSIPGTVEIMQKLYKKGYPLFGLSNWSNETFPRIQDKYPFFGWFDDILLSGDVKLIKPDPAIFNLLLTRIGYLASECVLIDDSKHNIDSAKKLGFETIHFASPEILHKEFQRLKVL